MYVNYFWNVPPRVSPRSFIALQDAGAGSCLYVFKFTDRLEPPNFDTYILVENPSDQEAEVFFSLMLEDGTYRKIMKVVPARSRQTVKVNDYTPYKAVSTKVESSVPVIAERAMYFDYLGFFKGGHDCSGLPAPGKTWYLAEGYTAEGFDTYLLLQNPGETEASAKVTYMLPGSKTQGETYSVPAHSRKTVSVDSIPGLEATELSMRVDSNVDIVAERAMYFEYYGKVGGHVQAGVSSPSDTWQFAEGYTAEGFDSYVLLQNPGDSPAHVSLTFMEPDGNTTGETRTIEAHSRDTVKVDDIGGLSSSEFSTSITSDEPIICERAMYFDYTGGIDGGHDAVGASATSTTWHLAEGYTAGEFDTFVLLSNPSDQTAHVRATFYRSQGTPVTQEFSMAAGTRHTIETDKIPGLEAAEFSTLIESTNGIGVVAERAVYFSYGSEGWRDGHAALGVTAPSTDWYFAEGYTGL
ncbi:MAG: DUF5719 family protein [Actinomycetota bacterium]